MTDDNEEGAGTRPMVLVVDDNEELCAGLRRTLRKLDVEVVIANTGDEALKATLHYRFAVAILDVGLPDIYGFDLAEMMRAEEHAKDLPIIFLTGVHMSPEDVGRGYEIGATDYLVKPVNAGMLLNKVRVLTDLDRQREELAQLNERLSHDAKSRREMELELREKALRLEQSNQELSSFAHHVSHDLKGPLRTVRNFVKKLHKRLAGTGHEAEDSVTRISTSVERMGAFIDSLMELSLVSTYEPKLRQISLTAALDNVRQDLKDAIEQANVTFELGDLPKVRADAAQLHRLLLNIISNSIKYRQQERECQISIRSDPANDEQWQIAIADNGIGFKSEHAARVFEPLARLHSDDEIEGTGVGLAVCKKLVEQHGGKIWAQSQPGVGTTVFFTINGSD